MSTIDELVHSTGRLFQETFGTTPLPERIADILKEATELSRFDTLKGLRSETGDLLASLLSLLHECGWDAEELLSENRGKIIRRAHQYSRLGRRFQVAILGGAFDPITKGHIALARHVLGSGHFDMVWIMPCGEHMDGKNMSPAHHRVKMCQLASASDKRLVVSTYEIDKGLAGETYHLVKHLLSEDFAMTQYQFSMIIGMDNANSFEKWVNYEYLERMIPFVVVPRSGVATDPRAGWYHRPPHLVLAEPATPIDVSSTIAREQLRNGADESEVAPYLEASVRTYAMEHLLYAG